ncbi:MAG: L-aspartate oxidase [Oscillospiraceae bacterium]|nr:L-aspartate oxidase [Oscillospiraceae bacterium]
MHYNVVIVGSGLAGLYAALHLAESDMRVLLLSKQAPKDSSSAMAQGGVAAVLEREDDSFALHRDDTLAAGNYKNDIDAVETLVHEGPEDVRRVMSLGVQFDRTPEGELATTIEGGHSRRRVVHHADRTGREMMDKLVPHVREQANATLLEDATVYAAEKLAGGGFAVDALLGGQPQRFTCDFLLLATGGIGQVYRHTTNPAVCTGDGIRLAYELGATLRNMRYVQFHPTAFAGGGEDEISRSLITEAVRGEGGLLLNAEHERFMHHYDAREELAPRDVVSRAIVLETQRMGSTDIYLDIRHRGEAFLRQRFPGIYRNCLRNGVDITRDLIPVFPCQHYHMGGVEVDLHSRTSVPGLYAAGECAHTGLHGGNRLASNSLPEALVFGRRAAEDIMRNAQCVMRNEAHGERPNNCELRLTHYALNQRELIQQTMQDTFFVFPNKAKLPAAAAQMRALYEELVRETGVPTRESAELRSLACVAMLILEELL